MNGKPEWLSRRLKLSEQFICVVGGAGVLNEHAHEWVETVDGFFRIMLILVGACDATEGAQKRRP